MVASVKQQAEADERMTKPKRPEPIGEEAGSRSAQPGADQERLRRWVSFLALCGGLDRSIQAGDLAGYYIKGGDAMELGFAERTRATKGLDVGIEGTRASRLKSLSEVLRGGPPAPRPRTCSMPV